MDLERRWLVLIATLLSQTLATYSLQSFPPINPLFIEFFEISRAEAGLMMSFFAFPGIILSLPSGVLADRFGARTIGLIALLSISIGNLVVGLSPSAGWAYGGRLASGLGFTVVQVLNLKIIARWFEGKDLSKAMGVYAMAFPASSFLTLSISGWLGTLYGWGAPFHIGFAFGLASIAFFASTVRDDSSQQRKGLQLGLLNNTTVWVIAMVWGLGGGAMQSFVTWTPAFLVETKSIDIPLAGFATSLLMITNALMDLAAGLVLARLRLRWGLIVMSELIIAGIILIFPWLDLQFSMVFIFLIGIPLAFIPVTIYTLVSETMGSERAGIGYGLNTTLRNVGVTLAVPFTGYVRDIGGSYIYSYWVISSIMISAVALIIGYCAALKLRR